MKVAQHLTDSQLQAFAQGDMDLDEFGAAEEHLANCDLCCQRLATEPENTLLSLARAAMTLGGSNQSRTAAAACVPSDLVDHPRYRILESIGVGGMGAVFKAEHRLMQRVVALKLVHPWLLSNPQAVERFEREVRLAARLSHPNIVVAYDADQTAQRHFLVMEYVEGETLQERINREGPVSVPQAGDWVLQAAKGLQHAHEQGMTHRDIKPQNLMITPNGRVRILDFGLSRLASEPPITQNNRATQGAPQTPSVKLALNSGLDTRSCLIARTDASTILGTPDYIAPEQIDSSATVDTRADIYSLGCTLYYLLAGSAPFHSSNIAETLDGHRRLAFPDIRTLRPDVPPTLYSILQRMTSKAIDSRYDCPADLVNALESLIDGRATSNPRAKVQTPFFQAASSSRRSNWSRRRSMTMAAIAVGTLLMASLAPLVMRSQPTRLLVMLPSEGLWFPDYEELVNAANEQIGKVQLIFASAAERPSQVLSTSKPGIAVPDVKLSDQLKASDYDGLVFIGYLTQEFSPNSGPSGEQTARLINEFQMQKKVIGGLCAGQRILAQHGALRGKRVAVSESIRDEEIVYEGGTRTAQPVVADGLVVTAASATHADEFIKNLIGATDR